MLFVPAFAYAVRAAYLDRKLWKIGFPPILAAALVFIGYIFSKEAPYHQAGAEALKIFLSGLVFWHMLFGLQHATILFAPQWPEMLFFESKRVFSLIDSRTRDIYNLTLARRRKPGISLKEKISLFFQASASIASQLMLVARDMSRALDSRGTWPRARDWVKAPDRTTWMVWGDIALLVLCTLAYLYDQPGWVFLQTASDQIAKLADTALSFASTHYN